MPRRLLLVNGCMAVLAAAFLVYIVWELGRPSRPATPNRARQAAPVAGQPQAGAPVPATGGYGVVASRNLFSPSRSESPVTAAIGGGPAVGKPNLFGVVLRDGAPIAYLEDPVTKRVSGYRVGDAVAGGTVQTIAADRVVLARPDGAMDVRLHDPMKPRPAALPAPGVPAPEGTVQPGVPPTTGVIPPPMLPTPAIQPPVQIPMPNQATQPPPLAPPGRRALPPNLLRRPSDGPNQ